ncbi:MAG: hypothetical protein JW982_12185, partial [Spirochaetes bacterium]|nr:hypothetical protein [Spirochaetota bacterium]
GKYIKKIAVPNLIIPAHSLINPIMKKAIKNGEMRDVNILFTFLQIIGGIVFFNIIRMSINDSIMGKLVFKGNFMEDFKKNMINVLEKGLIVQKENGK